MIKYILTETELRDLLQDQKRLEALEAYGVNNWYGYEEAMNDEEYEVTYNDLAGYTRIGTTECSSTSNTENTRVEK